MNVHHLELFYYVATHGGIMPAVRNMPYGIQQPAVSSQMTQLEEFLGTALFQRRPFALTAEGKKLFQFVQPFFSNLDKVANDLQGGQTRQIRIGASAIILRDYLPEIFQAVSKKFPKLKLSLREGYPGELEGLLQQGELDLAITLIEGKPLPGIHVIKLLELEPALLVEAKSPLQSAEELWKRDRIEDTLISLPGHEALVQHFQQGLAKLGVDWFPGIGASSIELIESYVSKGLGIGLSLKVPERTLPKNVRILPLAGFQPVVLGITWQGPQTPVISAFIQEAGLRAKRFQ